MSCSLNSSKKLVFCGSIVTLCAIIFGLTLSTLFKSVSTNVNEPTLEFVITVSTTEIKDKNLVRCLYKCVRILM